jgi:hypothetical protein
MDQPPIAEEHLHELLWEMRVVQVSGGDLEIREIYTWADGSLAGWTAAPEVARGHDVDDLRDLVTEMEHALELPVLVEDDLGPAVTRPLA